MCLRRPNLGARLRRFVMIPFFRTVDSQEGRQGRLKTRLGGMLARETLNLRSLRSQRPTRGSPLLETRDSDLDDEVKPPDHTREHAHLCMHMCMSLPALQS